MSSQHSLDKYFKTRRMASTRSAIRFFRTQHNMTLLRPTSSLPRKRLDVGRRQGAPGLRDGSAVRCCDTWCKAVFDGVAVRSLLRVLVRVPLRQSLAE